MTDDPATCKDQGPLTAGEVGNGHGANRSPSEGGTGPRSVKLLRFPDVRERTGLSRSTIWRLERHGSFPKHRRISANAVAWVEEEVIAWIRSKIDDIAV